MNIIFTIFNNIFNGLYSITGDYGISIILLTLVVRSLFLPMSIKQKKTMEKHQETSKKVEMIKQKYKNNKSKLDEELQKIYLSNSVNMLGCLPMLMQVPIMYSLYKVFSSMVLEVGTKLVPWISTLSVADPYFILPMITVIVQLLPNILSTIGIIKNTSVGKLTPMNAVMIGGFSILFLVKAPAAIALYMIATSLYSAAEQIIYSIYSNKKCIA
ncbi:membrane protein insertase YidC [Clostridium sp. MB40-C1]|uniref:YidC/Oxa1 family membrane protein insertase n=1 Tax=Clostridium sp. MB40-C1 TaxID=3070996 RepID=UPI0027E2078C|nr:membrane protein insertase YidC [Clostridium sp. MB40-C1]WMJ80920.1 membrane protein insertase YidC [Clostridium sp. MB40-C1]